MLHQTQHTPVTAELLGDVHAFIEQLGSPGTLTALAGLGGAPQIRQINSVEDLRKFLRDYHDGILKPIELPAIHHAFNHASHNEFREILAFDRQLAGEPLLQSFASASRRVGQAQLERLRPLRDHRLIQRYLAAVGCGEAHGWHTLIYGLTLAVYSLPLRQGLFGYAQQTTRGFIQAAARSLALTEPDSQKLLDEFSATMPAAVEMLVAPSAFVGSF